MCFQMRDHGLLVLRVDVGAYFSAFLVAVAVYPNQAMRDFW